MAQYVDAQLSSDGLHFANPVYDQMLAEAVAHSGEDDFVAEKYFKLHPDYELSKAAIDLTIDEMPLSKRFEMSFKQDTLRQYVVHLVADFFWETTISRLALLREEMAQRMAEPDKLKELME